MRVTSPECICNWDPEYLIISHDPHFFKDSENSAVPTRGYCSIQHIGLIIDPEV